MPSRLASPVLTVDMSHIAKVDPSNVDNLFSMWTIFSKCAESLENGRRLENLSWRLWNRETFCCDDVPPTAARPIKKPPRQDSDTYTDIPELSCSVDSAPSEDELSKDRFKDVKPSQPCLIRRDLNERYRGKEKHMTPVHLVKIMEDIDKNKTSGENWTSRKSVTSNSTDRATIFRGQPLPPSSVFSAPLVRNASDPSETGIPENHSVVRGFSPGRVSSSYRSSSNIPADPSPVKVPMQKKPKAVFYLGSSSSCSDDEIDDSFSNHFENKSKLSDGLRRSSGDKKTSFRDEVTTRTVYEDGASTEDDGISESAIEDDDCSDWESSTDSIHSSYEDGTLFKRVDSRPHLISQRSLLSTMLHEPERAADLANAAAKAPPVLRRRTNSPHIQHDTPPPSTNNVNISHSRPIIMTTTNTHPPAFSPRTTRRNMLATELTESLRKHLLWERQQKNTTVTAHLKRRHTAHDVTNLAEYPQPTSGKGRASKNNSWTHRFDQGPYEYHAAGW